MFKKITIVVVVAIGACALFAAAQSDKERREKKDDIYTQVELFSDALTLIQAEYVDEKKSKDLIYGALKGMVDSLDPHSQFLDEETYNELKVETEGKFGGIGIEITVKDGLLTVISPIEDTPAWKAGVKPGDRIVKIEKELTRDMTLSDAVKKMRGKPGTELRITVLRESEERLIEFKMVRDMIRVKDIKDARILENNVGYIRVIEFRENTGQEMRNTLENLKKQGMESLVLDLRNNPGGLLDQAIRVAENFIEEGKLICSTKSRVASQNMEFVSKEKRPFANMPLVVLINEGSASGSEIVAGALQDYHRAIIMGTKSFGKGSVQSVVPLTDGSAIRLTTSKYFTPSGRSIHGEGIQPDIVVEQEEIAKENPADETMRKKIAEVFEEVEKEEKSAGKDAKKEEYKKDTQLVRAVDLLKAIKIFKMTELNNATIQK